jgi:NAD(P)-dependent dehydrogenase (short-subunit alcohol dehydrogenase family)
VAAEGGAVVLGARGKDAGEQVAADIRAAGGRALFVPTDVCVEEEVARLTQAALTEYGRLDGAFNNAGTVNAFGPVSEIDETGWRADIELNLTSVFYGLRHQVPALIASGGGAILNNASNLGVVGMGQVAPYVAPIELRKAGVSTAPETMAFIRTPCSAASSATARVSPTTPCLAATYGAT